MSLSDSSRHVAFPYREGGAPRSAPGVPRRRNPVQSVVADMEIFPANGIVKRMGARIAPVTVEIELGQRRPRARQFVQLVRRQDRDLGRQHLGLGDGDRRLGDAFVGRAINDPVDRQTRPFEQSLGGVEFDFQVADLRDREHVLGAALLPAVDPRPGETAHELDRILDRAARDARVDRRLDDLRDGAVRRRILAAEIGGNNRARLDANLDR